MLRSVVLRIALVGAILALAACSGATTAEPSGTGAGSAAPSTPASAPASASASAGASTAPSAEPSAGSGGTGEACDLITAEEAAGVLDVSIASTQAQPGEPSYCQYVGSDGKWYAATSLAHNTVAWDTFANEAGATTLDVPGVEAVFSPSTETVFVRKGDTMLGITAGLGAGVTPTEERMELGRQLAIIAAPRI